MVDTRLLKSHMVKVGKTGVDMASALGICYASWVNKSSGKRDFTLAQVLKIKELLSLSNEQACEIFFN